MGKSGQPSEKVSMFSPFDWRVVSKLAFYLLRFMIVLIFEIRHAGRRVSKLSERK